MHAKPILSLLVLFLGLPRFSPRTVEHNSTLKLDIADDYRGSNGTTEGSATCTNCANRKRYEQEQLDPVEFRLARIEVIKQQILRKLRLKAPPHIRLPKSVLPSVLSHGHVPVLTTSGEKRESDSQNAADDFYGTTHNVVVFPENNTESRRCMIRAPYPTSCFTFRLSAEVQNRAVAAAELWVFKTTPAREVNQTFVVSEILSDRGVLRKRILAIEDTTMRSGWLRFAVGSAVSRWAAKPHLMHVLEISCKGCPRQSEYTEEAPVSVEERQQPFMVVTAGPSNGSGRSRRSLDCTDSTTRCCRESFYLSFKEIGWDDWILQPQGYTANYCRGSCLTDVSISRYHHTTVLQRFIQSQKAKNEETTLSLCCTPSRMSSISLIYLDDDGFIFQKSLPNMVVESCDCA